MSTNNFSNRSRVHQSSSQGMVFLTRAHPQTGSAIVYQRLRQLSISAPYHLPSLSISCWMCRQWLLQGSSVCSLPRSMMWRLTCPASRHFGRPVKTTMQDTEGAQANSECLYGCLISCQLFTPSHQRLTDQKRQAQSIAHSSSCSPNMYCNSPTQHSCAHFLLTEV